MSHPALTGPVSLRVSVTDRCQYRCLYCTPQEGVELFSHDRILRHEEVIRFVRTLRKHVGISKVHITGGEPLIRRGLTDLVSMLASEGIADLAMTTNGLLLADHAAALARAGLKRVNVSLHSLCKETFRQITRGGELARTLAGIDAAAAAGLQPIKLNVTILRELNDAQAPAMAQFAMDRNMTLRFIELMPIGEATKEFALRYVPARDVLERLAREFTLTALPRRPGSSSREFGITNSTGQSGTVGVITSTSEVFCGDCNRLRLSACGELIGCLARTGGVDITPLLRADGPVDEEQLMQRVAEVMSHKRTSGGFHTNRHMPKVGG